MRGRKLLLYGGLGLVAIVFVGDKLLTSFVDEPLQKAEAVYSAIEQQIRNHELELAKAEQALTLLPELQERSLPRKLDLAKSEYQAWLLQLVSEIGLRAPAVNPKDAVNQKNLLHVLKFDVRGRGTLTQIADFLFQFYQAGHLHKITSMTLNPLQTSRQVDMSVSIEAISLSTATRDDQLTSRTSDQLASSNLKEYSALASRDLFNISGGNLVAQQTILTAITADVRGTWEAWFSGPRGETKVVRAGEALVTVPFSAKLLGITENHVLISIEGDTRKLGIGRSLSEATMTSPDA